MTTRREFIKHLAGFGAAIVAGVKGARPLQMGGDAPKGAMLAEPPTSPSDVTVKWTDSSWSVKSDIDTVHAVSQWEMPADGTYLIGDPYYADNDLLGIVTSTSEDGHVWVALNGGS